MKKRIVSLLLAAAMLVLLAVPAFAEDEHVTPLPCGVQIWSAA